MGRPQWTPTQSSRPLSRGERASLFAALWGLQAAREGGNGRGAKEVAARSRRCGRRSIAFGGVCRPELPPMRGVPCEERERQGPAFVCVAGGAVREGFESRARGPREVELWRRASAMVLLAQHGGRGLRRGDEGSGGWEGTHPAIVSLSFEFLQRSDTGGQSRTKCVRDARLWRRLQGERTRGQKTNSPPKHWYYSGTTCALTHPNKTPRPLTDVRPSRWRTRVAACECAHTVWRARCAASRRGAVCAHAEGRRTSSAWR